MQKAADHFHRLLLLGETYGGQRYFYVKDRRFSVTALADAAGSIVERYEYSAFGRMSIFNAAGQAITATRDKGSPIKGLVKRKNTTPLISLI